MKKLEKLAINPEKVIKNEELVNLRGGSYAGGCTPGDAGSGYWTCCVNDTPHKYMKDNATDAERVCEDYYGEGNCDCEE